MILLKKIAFYLFFLQIRKVVDEMITIYLENLRTTKVKGGKKPKPKPKPKPLKLPGLVQVNKKDPRDLLGEVIIFYKFPL